MVNSTISESCQNIDQLFQKLQNKQDKYHHVFDLGKAFEGISEDLKTKESPFLVKGCMSLAWLIPRFEEGRVFFGMDSEALIVKGIMALFHQVYNSRTPDEILSVKIQFWLDLGLVSLLSMNRRTARCFFSNRFSCMVPPIKVYLLWTDRVTIMDCRSKEVL